MASAKTLLTLLVGVFTLVSSGTTNDDGNSSCILKYDDWSSPQSRNSCLCDVTKGVFGEILGGLLNCVNGVVELYPKFCVTSYNASASGPELLVGGMCPFVQLQRYGNVKVDPHSDYASITIQSCAPSNRTGTLCGRCDGGTSVAVTDPWSFLCVSDDQCSPLNCFLYFLAEFGSLTAMFLFVYVFGINVAAPYSFGYVTFAQVIPLYTLNILRTTRDSTVAFNTTKFLLSLYSMWSLEVFSLFVPPLCCITNITNMDVIALKYIGAVYPLLLVLGSYLLLKLHQWNVTPIVFLSWPFRAFFQRVRIEMDSTSLLKTFCTFVSLAFVKISIISLMLIADEDIKTESGELVGRVLLYDGTVALWGPDHAPHAIVAIFVLAVFFFLPCLVLILYPLCNVQKHLGVCGCSSRYIQYLSAFMEVFYGHFKDGTGGSRDYRCLGGMQFIFKFLLFLTILIGPTKINEEPNFFVLQIGAMFWTLLILVLQPYKNENHAKFEAGIMLYISMTMSVGIYTDNVLTDVPQYTFFALLFLPSLASIVVGLAILARKIRCCTCCHRRAPRKLSVPAEIIRSLRSTDLSERFIDDRLATYIPMQTAHQNE